MGEENCHLVEGLGRQREEVPEHVGVFQVGGGVALLSVDEVGEFQGVADEEDRGVVPHDVVVAFFGVELDGQSHGGRARVGRARSLPTVEKRAKTSVRLPTAERNLARVYFVTSAVTSK